MTLNWLHISDLHMGLPGQKHLWPNVEREFYRDLQDYCSKNGPVDVVFLQGISCNPAIPTNFSTCPVY